MSKKLFRRKVQKVIDGDTLKVSHRIHGSQYVRLPNINAPEKRQFGYLEAKRRLQRLEGKTITIRPQGRSYRRIVGDVSYKRRKIR